MSEHPIAPASLAELPEHRREHLLWLHALQLDYHLVLGDVLLCDEATGRRLSAD